MSKAWNILKSFNEDESKKGKMKLAHDVEDKDGEIIPKGTIVKFTSFKKGKNVQVNLKSPDGLEVVVKAKSLKDLKHTIL